MRERLLAALATSAPVRHFAACGRGHSDSGLSRTSVDSAQKDACELHLVMDNYAAHKRVEVRDWLAANPRIHIHFTPTSGSWLNLVEVWFGIIERQAIHRGSFGAVKDLNAKIRAFIDGWNDQAHPFVWTKTAEEILKKANRQTTSNTDHKALPWYWSARRQSSMRAPAPPPDQPSK